MNYLYRITNTINNKIYIGITNNPQKRWSAHCASNPKHYYSMIHAAIVKYGKENFVFEVLEQYEDREEVLKREKELIALYNCLTPNGYNIHEGGGVPPIHNKISLEIAQSIIQDLKDPDIPRRDIINKYKITFSILENINLGAAWRNNELDYPLRENEHDLQLRRSNKIKDLLENTQLSRLDIAHQCNVSEATVSAINNGKVFFEENRDYPIRKRSSFSRKGAPGKIVLQIDDNNNIINEFVSAAEAGRRLNLNSNGISKCRRGEQKQCGGYKWKFKTDN